MTAQELRALYMEFFKEKGHRAVAPASLLPDNDPSVLFTTAGMHPLIPFLLGEVHPLGRRLVNVQKCVRTCDIDEVGDPTHLTFFEMLGNWSLGDYFKEEAITMSFELLTARLGIPADRLAVTVFEGDELAPRDQEAFGLWKRQGLRDQQIYFYGRDENWWGPAGITGPCGPDTEIFYDTGKPKCGDACGPACRCGKYVEIWNNVFMEYEKQPDGTYRALAQKNVDTGMGFERMLAIMNEVDSVYETELFRPMISTLEKETGVIMTPANERPFRIICEHARAAAFILGEGITPGNTEQGYIVRRLLRRAIRHSKDLFGQNVLPRLIDAVVSRYGDIDPGLKTYQNLIQSEIEKESALFERTLERGLKKAEQYFADVGVGGRLAGDSAFRLYDTFGFPIELTRELAEERGCTVDMKQFEAKFREHQEKSRQGAEAKFRGGMADNSEQTTRLHTATHLLNGALRRVLGGAVLQKGSNINAQRLRFDFSFGRRLTQMELRQISDLVNEAIRRDIRVECETMSVEEAKRQGAVGVFEDRYGDLVKVYTIAGYSKEICGGPHARSTGELVSFTIEKETSSSSGVRRIKAVIG